LKRYEILNFIGTLFVVGYHQTSLLEFANIIELQVTTANDLGVSIVVLFPKQRATIVSKVFYKISIYNKTL